MKYVLLWIAGVALFYMLVDVNQAVALLSMLTVITSPMMKLSWEIAMTEDRRVKQGGRNVPCRTASQGHYR
jgi:hypothetical protein